MTGRKAQAPRSCKCKGSRTAPQAHKENCPPASNQSRNKDSAAPAPSREGYVPLTLTAVSGPSDTSCIERQLRRTSISIVQKSEQGESVAKRPLCEPLENGTPSPKPVQRPSCKDSSIQEPKPALPHTPIPASAVADIGSSMIISPYPAGQQLVSPRCSRQDQDQYGRTSPQPDSGHPAYSSHLSPAAGGDSSAAGLDKFQQSCQQALGALDSTDKQPARPPEAGAAPVHQMQAFAPGAPQQPPSHSPAPTGDPPVSPAHPPPSRLPGLHQGSRQAAAAASRVPRTLQEAEHTFAAFPKQSSATDFAAACHAALAPCQPQASGGAEAEPALGPVSLPIPVVQVFCRQSQADFGWYRDFVAASYPALWARYRHPHARHFYEVVQQGHPCHLYFDLEFATSSNPGLQGEGLVDLLMRLVTHYFRSKWGIDLGPSAFLEMDSSCEGKFSRHLVIRAPQAAFANNTVVGAAVNDILSMPQACGLDVRKDGSGFTSLVDTAVYTRNRHFRCLWSSKGGKAQVLDLTARCQQGLAKMSPYQLLCFSMVCNVPPGSRLLQGSLAAALIPQPPGGSSACATLGMVQRGPGGLTVAWRHDALDEASPAGNLPMECVLTWAQAALPWVEALGTLRSGGKPARVRTVARCGCAGRVAFSMIGPGSHFCLNIGRMHQSNHVFFVLDFVSGTFAQKCHDPACASFRSPWEPLPPEMHLKA